MGVISGFLSLTTRLFRPRTMLKTALLFALMGLVCSANAQAPGGKNRQNGGNKPATTNSSTSAPSNPLNYPDQSNDNPDSVRNDMPEGIVYDSGEEADSLLRERVFRFHRFVRDVKMRSFSHPLLEPSGIQFFNPVHTMNGDYYIDRGALGQVHLSLFPFSPSSTPLPLQNRFAANPSPVYCQQLHWFNLFQTQTPYTVLSYGSSLNKDYQISIVHTQNIKPRWNIAFLYDLVSRDGLYTNSDVTNHILDATTNYYSEDSRYQLQAGITMNRLRQQENGGVQNDTTCWDYPRESGVPINMYAAQNQWREFGVWIHQSYNTVRQFEYHKPLVAQTKDSLPTDTIIGYDTIRPHQPHTFNTGVFALDLNFNCTRRIFSDTQADGWFYNTTPDTTFFFDSTQLYRFDAELYWTNDAYMSHRWKNPVSVYAGIRPEVSTLHFASDTLWGSGIHEFAVNTFARAIVELHRFKLQASAEEVTGRRRNGDYRLNASASIQAGSNSIFSASVLSEALSPDLVFYHNKGSYNWHFADDAYNKTKRQQVSLDYHLMLPDTTEGHLRMIHTYTSATLLSDNVWLNSSMMPVQGNATGLLLQAYATTQLRFGWFNIKLAATLQNCNDDNVIRVPLFAGKSSMYADTYLFHKALRLQTGIDLRYHTRYYADGWNPVLGAFYRQDGQQVGNYIVADAWINMQIKRASIYLKASHFNAPIESILNITPNYFSLPHYPMEAFGLYWGITWKFFN